MFGRLLPRDAPPADGPDLKGRTRATNQAALDQLLEVRHVDRSILQKGFDRYPAHSNVVFK